MSDRITEKTVHSAVIALGYFDSVHIGHRAVINRAEELAEKLSANLAVFTFSGNLRAAINGGEEKFVYSAAEREEILRSLGAKEVIFAPADRTFLDTDKRDFLAGLCEKYNAAGFACGKDYRFGKGGEGDAEYLKEYAAQRGLAAVIADTVLLGGEKVSTTGIKALLAAGDVKAANARLGSPFFIGGKVLSGRKVGRKLGFPTVNVLPEKDKQPLKEGVYAGFSVVGGKRLPAIINYGARPTYGLSGVVVEAHLIGYEGDLYGKYIRIYFTGYMRGIKKFACEEELMRQLESDRTEVLSGKYD